MEIPTAAEILGLKHDDLEAEKEDDSDDGDGDGDSDGDSDDSGQDAIDIPVNIIHGPWASRADYLRAHYELLREDAIAPLRDAVAAVRETPEMEDGKAASIYDKVRILGYTFSTQGPAARVVFSTARVGKRILWEQSKRLIPGTLVALSPAEDKFEQRCTVAVVAARPLAGVQANPPEVDLLFAQPQMVEIDPLQEWLMVEARTGYFEAYRHTLTALQAMMYEKFPMSEHLVDLHEEVKCPEHVLKNPFMDFSTLSVDFVDGVAVRDVNVLDCFPATPPSNLDQSQLQALERILTKKMAIIQGPPGTGKTHVSVTALQVLLKSRAADDPPIIIASQTNHALDQMLRHIAPFEDNFVRLGGRTLDQEVIKLHTLHELRKLKRMPVFAGGLRGPAQSRLRRLEQKMTTLLDPLHEQAEPFSAETFHSAGLISEAQKKSLDQGHKGWVHAVRSDHPSGSVAAWLGDELVHINHFTRQEDLGLEYEDSDLEFEQIKETEAEAVANDDNFSDCLAGSWRPITERFTARADGGVAPQALKRALCTPNMWDIPSHLRGAVYVSLQASLKKTIRDQFRQDAARYMDAVQDLKIGKWEFDCEILRTSHLIGMTTTGLSKYRALVASLQPKILLVEEAAETLEGQITAGCVDSLEHLILVGDHKQLRGHCAVHELEGEPYNLGISMFERLIINGVEFSTLTCQRRMATEIRKNLMPIYDELHDHESVRNKTPVPGMGALRSFFFTHSWLETQDSNFSRCNETEAEMVVGCFNHLVWNGVQPEQITVLTFYNGQRKLILKKLRLHRNLQGQIFNVKTVDAYQGEENAVVLLSLVRSNHNGDLGFLSIENRRAQRGFYLFGNALQLSQGSQLWWNVVKIMSKEPRRVGICFPVSLTNGATSWVAASADCKCGATGPITNGVNAPTAKPGVNAPTAKPGAHAPATKPGANGPIAKPDANPSAAKPESSQPARTAPAVAHTSVKAWKDFAKKAAAGQLPAPSPRVVKKAIWTGTDEPLLLDLDSPQPGTLPVHWPATTNDHDQHQPKVTLIEDLPNHGGGVARKRWTETVQWNKWIAEDPKPASPPEASLLD
ncbi:MAG: hypothetical protein M1826_000766 [Phylliscum demangeonii]|nr:MAG: hypothetical protein M1826_000766 [Phylliscum demangeonii]